MLRCPRTRTTDLRVTTTGTTRVTTDKDRPTCRCRQQDTTCQGCLTLLPTCQGTGCRRTPCQDLKEAATTPLQLPRLPHTPVTLLHTACPTLRLPCPCSTVSSSRTTSRDTAACHPFLPACTAVAENVAAGADPAAAVVRVPRVAPRVAHTAGRHGAGLRLESTENTSVATLLGESAVTRDLHDDNQDSKSQLRPSWLSELCITFIGFNKQC